MCTRTGWNPSSSGTNAVNAVSAPHVVLQKLKFKRIVFIDLLRKIQLQNSYCREKGGINRKLSDRMAPL